MSVEGGRDISTDELLTKLGGWQIESQQNRTRHEHRWAKNIHLITGVFTDEKQSESRVRKRSNLFFRKIWATNWRLLASFYRAFLSDDELFKITGRDNLNDHQKAEVLHNMVVYHNDVMMNESSLFVKFIWALQNIIDLGWAPAKLSWRKDKKHDGPEFTLYPVEQVYPDFGAWTKDKMRYAIFESFLTKSELKAAGYENIDEARAESIPHNLVREARLLKIDDPLQNPQQAIGENSYPASGHTQDTQFEEAVRKYKVWESFYWEDGMMKFSVSNGKKLYFKEPIDSPYGDDMPIIMGNCLLRAFQMVGEGFPEPLEGPQESYNDTINKRKDNVSLSLNQGSVVSRYGNVDLNALTNAKPGRVVLADDPSAVVFENRPDVTQTAYMEAAADDAMINEMSGTPPIKQGLGPASAKATTSQINQNEGTAKFSLFGAIVGDTFFREFYYQLAKLIQRFETDKKVFLVANETFRKDNNQLFAQKVDRVDDFNINCKITVGIDDTSKQQQINQLLQAIQQANASNQAGAALMQVGQVPPDGLEFINIPKITKDLFHKIGQKNTKEYFFKMQPLPQESGAASEPTPLPRSDSLQQDMQALGL